MSRLLLCICVLLFSSVAWSKPQQFYVGVLANWGHQHAIERWTPMMEYLNEHVPDAEFHVYPGNFEALNLAMELGQIQFIITNPGQYLYLSNQYPLSWLATMRSKRHNGTTSAIGSAIIVKADSNYRTLYDLKGKVVAASDPHALGGYQATVGLMHSLGMDPDTFFGETKFLGFPLDPLLYQVRDGNVDAAITPLCTLEDMVARGVLKSSDFRVLNPSRPDGVECQCSTTLYPNWSFAATESVSPELSKEITQALLELPSDSPAAIKAQLKGWTSPISQLAVIKLFKELHVKTPDSSRWEAVKKWLEENRHWGILSVFVFIIATLYHLWIEYRFHQKSSSLIESERQLKQQAVALERLQSASIVGEIGAGLAHEINQPIAAITSYSEGGIMRLQGKQQADVESCIELLEKIHKQSTRAGEVVHRIRGLLKRREAVMVDVNILTLVEESISLLRLELARREIQINTQIKGEPFFISADRVGLLQVLINLIKNSLDAIADSENARAGKINIELNFKEFQVNVHITDNGQGLAMDSDTVMATFYTTKVDGLGLGLAICKEVISDHDGHFMLCNRDDGVLGCVAMLSLKKRGSEAPIEV
ncbi:PhnD/SsuA/transferrin family substrate-binding protein [Shewanella schlegeliana]|uniref:histidine kinase n=1 Tax=Shewanella schlegeliana TaxID=190308 RepID=A0ABS1SYE3_9GAMM|nr:sensor histidine kinase [Shewanella schlegeliana]MBL4913576.1 PhnD/SsuA/transferrin family substrate-binding protein [Shewanella schlegeliana]MCL1108467.1 PhnD/SsuA/transferrin family substrate-binding protein [Shewanella schlegeliana]GIU28549.1 sensor histidine kinase [Shewanella schlegeliana]